MQTHDRRSHPETQSRPQWLFAAITIGVCLLISCLLLPPLIGFLRSTALGSYSAGKIARRVFMIAGILGLASQWKRLSLPSPSLIGFAPHRGAVRNLLVGAAVGYGSLGLVCVGMLYASYRYYSGDDSWATWFTRIPAAAVAAALIAVLEEYLFRGVLLSALRRRFSAVWAVAFCSLIFGSLHFFTGKGAAYDPATLHWYTGFVVAGNLLAGMVGELDAVAFTGIFLVGTVLCIAAVRTKSLYLSIGLHFGWVFCIKTLVRSFKRVGESNIWFGGSQFYDGLLGPVGLLLIIPLILLLIRRRILVCNTPDET